MIGSTKFLTINTMRDLLLESGLYKTTKKPYKNWFQIPIITTFNMMILALIEFIGRTTKDSPNYSTIGQMQRSDSIIINFM